jgi:hypothetical protein
MEVAMEAVELRPMGIGDILDTSFKLYKSRFAAFLIIAFHIHSSWRRLYRWQPRRVAGRDR